MTLILVVDDEPDVEELFRQQFRRDLRAGRFTMDFAQSAKAALQRISEAESAALILAGPGGSRPAEVPAPNLGRWGRARAREGWQGETPAVPIMSR